MATKSRSNSRSGSSRTGNSRSARSARSKSNGRKGNGRMDAVSLLEHDHETVRKLLRELDESNSRGQRKRQQLLERVSAEIEAHAAIEEEIFYPSFRERGETEDDEKLFFEAAEEHQLVHWLLPELKATDPGSELFSARAKVLRDLIEHHAEEEERELLPRMRKLASRDELVRLGALMQERKRELLGTRSVSSDGGERAGRSRLGVR